MRSGRVYTLLHVEYKQSFAFGVRNYPHTKLNNLKRMQYFSPFKLFWYFEKIKNTKIRYLIFSLYIVITYYPAISVLQFMLDVLLI